MGGRGVRKGSGCHGDAQTVPLLSGAEDPVCFRPAKLAWGANYPVGWVQMPHSGSGGGEVAMGGTEG